MRVFAILVIGLLVSSCLNLKDKKTTLSIIDNNRHYYPILRGQELDIVFEIQNTGEYPFVLSDLITSCGCIMTKQSSISSIPAGKSRKLSLTYNSAKNIGAVEHFITLYGNFAEEEKMELTFDVNVVPDAHYIEDYEQLYLEQMRSKGLIKEAVDGDESQKGYYLDGDF